MMLGKLMHNKYLAIACLLLVILLMSACGGSGGGNGEPTPVAFQYTQPNETGDGWTTANAADLGVDISQLEGMMDAMANRFDIVDSVAIAYKGQLIFDETIRTELNEFDDWVDNTNLDMHVMFSASKSFASLAVGIAIDQGVFENVDIPYLSLFDYPSYQNWDARKDSIRLEDVLTLQLGLEWNEWEPPYSDPSNQMLRFYETEVDYSKSLLDLPMSAAPGSEFAYNTPASVSLGQAIENRAPISLIDFGLANVFTPLSISDVEVAQTPTGLPDLGRGLFMLTRDFLKIGQVYSDRGTWHGERIVSESWVNASFVHHTEFGWNEPDKFDWQLSGYGYQWWLGFFELNGRRFDAHAARGHGEQNLIVIPELELVVAVFSHAFRNEEDEVNQTFEMIADFILPALPNDQ